MGSLLGASSPKSLPTPARPVTAVAKTPDLELADTELASTSLGIKKKGKKALRTDVTKDVSTQVGGDGMSGLNIPKTIG